MQRTILVLLFFYICIYSNAQQNSGWVRKENFAGDMTEKGVAFVVKGNAYVGLGKDNAVFKNAFWKFSSTDEKWEKIADFPGTPRIFSVSFTISNTGYVGTGLIGVENNREGTNDFWEYDTEKDTWTQKASMPGGTRYGAVGFTINGKGYIGLGSNKSTYYNDLWEYNPTSNKWIRKADLPDNGRTDASAFTALGNGYVICGQGKELIPSKKKSWKYSPVKNEWTAIAEFPGSPRTGVITFSNKIKGYAIGGTNSGFKRFDDFWEYNALRNVWVERDPVPFGGCAYQFAFIFNDSAYVCSGKSLLKNEGAEVWGIDISGKYGFNKNLVIGGNLLLGNDRIPQAGIEMKVLNGKGQVINSAFTNLFGSFLLANLPEKEDLILTFESKDPTWKDQNFYITNRKDEPITILSRSNDFKFYLSPGETNKIQLLKLESQHLRMNMKGRLVVNDKARTPLANIGVSLMDEDGQVVQAGLTNENGNFVFDYLPVDSTVYLSIDEKIEQRLSKGDKILLLDDGENIVTQTSSASHEFALVNLPPEKNSITNFYIEDDWLPFLLGSQKIRSKVVEPIYFEVGKWDILPEAKGILNKAIIILKHDPNNRIEINAFTDSRGGAKSNLILSEKRAESAKEYMVSKGIDLNQITTKGYGETHLINKCKDGVYCSEEEHAMNRRMEFIIRKNKS